MKFKWKIKHSPREERRAGLVANRVVNGLSVLMRLEYATDNTIYALNETFGVHWASTEFNDVIRRLMNKAFKLTVKVRSSDSDIYCRGKILGYSGLPHTNVISICDRVFYKGTGFIASVVIHEMVHDLGFKYLFHPAKTLDEVKLLALEDRAVCLRNPDSYKHLFRLLNIH